VFREVILPVIEQELNEGGFFAFNRQMQRSAILAAWLKGFAQEESQVAAKLAWYIDKNRPDARRFERKHPARPLGAADTKAGSNHYIRRDDPAFRVTENVIFYERYLKLFERGLYRVVRVEQGDDPQQKIGRVYFSGGINFWGIQCEFGTKHSASDPASSCQ
jgi:hypothetical protein